jgi:amidase
MTDRAEIALLPASELRRRLGRREISAVEVLEACLHQIQRHDGVINAVVTRSEKALEEAQRLDEEVAQGKKPGLLHGLPVGIKDVTPVAGLRTTFGSPLYADFVPDQDALVVRRLRDAGAVILGKTNTPEFAAGGNTFNEVFGRTCNPWNTALAAGGSTGGGAAALASGMITLAEGTDLGGSLRMPASFCGVVGLRPSPGLVPTHPADFLWDNLYVTGPMARTAQDVALMLQAVCGPSPLSPNRQSSEGRDFVAAVRRGPADDLRVAYAPGVAGVAVDPDVERVCRAAVEGLDRVGGLTEQVEFDLSFGRDAFLAIRGLWMVTQHYSRLGQVEQLGRNLRGNVRAGLEVTTEQLAAAEAARGRIWELFRQLFERFDHLVTPCMAVPPFPVEEDYPETVGGRRMETYVDWFAPTFILSLAGLPVASVPCGLDANGLPVGLQVVGPPRGEEAVLALAGRIQQLRPIGPPPLVRA